MSRASTRPADSQLGNWWDAVSDVAELAASTASWDDFADGATLAIGACRPISGACLWRLSGQQVELAATSGVTSEPWKATNFQNVYYRWLSGVIRGEGVKVLAHPAARPADPAAAATVTTTTDRPGTADAATTGAPAGADGAAAASGEVLVSLAQSIRVGDEACGAWEVVVPKSVAISEREHLIGFLQQLCDLTSARLNRELSAASSGATTTTSPAASVELLTAAADTVTTLADSAMARVAAAVAANPLPGPVSQSATTPTRAPLGAETPVVKPLPTPPAPAASSGGTAPARSPVPATPAPTVAPRMAPANIMNAANVPQRTAPANPQPNGAPAGPAIPPGYTQRPAGDRGPNMFSQGAPSGRGAALPPGPPPGGLPLGGLVPGGALPQGATGLDVPAMVEVAPESDLVDFSLKLQRQLAVKDVAAVAVNDGRLWVGCDRMTVLTGPNNRLKVRATSGQARLNRRSKTIIELERLARLVVRSGVVLDYTGAGQEYPPQLEQPLTDYLSTSQARRLVAVPLVVTTPAPADKTRQEPRRETIGCLVVEQLTAEVDPPELTARAGRMAQCVAWPLRNAEQFESVFLLKLWQGIGSIRRILKGYRLALVAAVLAAIAVTVAAMLLVPWSYRVEGKGLILPADKRDVFVPHDGEVTEVLVTSGQQVEKGQLLVRLRNKELDSQLVATRTQLDEKRQQVHALDAQIDDAHRSPQKSDEIRLMGQREEAKAQVAGLTRQLTVLEERAAQLQVCAPVAGTVATFQVDQLLLHRPVKRGETLLSVVNESGPWQLELDVDEVRLGHLVRARNVASDEPLKVEFVLLTHSETSYFGKLKEVGTRATLNEENRLVVPAIVSLDQDRIPNQRIGAEVRARIDCGQKPLGYVLFGDVVEFIQRYVWW